MPSWPGPECLLHSMEDCAAPGSLLAGNDWIWTWKGAKAWSGDCVKVAARRVSSRPHGATHLMDNRDCFSTEVRESKEGCYEHTGIWMNYKDLF